MTQAYSNPERESDPYALPDVEIFYLTRQEAQEMFDPENNDDDWSGWYYWFCFPGCLPDSDAVGPFDTETEALADAQDNGE